MRIKNVLFKLTFVTLIITGISLYLTTIVKYPTCSNNMLTFSDEGPCHSFERQFTIDYENNQFLKDGKPFRFIGGSIHYQRVPHIYWRDRLLKAKAAGLDLIQTYVPWNFHEYEEGEYNFNGDGNLLEFIQIAQEIELDFILRIGPYICAEWELGGLPVWLLRKYPDVILRSNDFNYMNAVRSWFQVLLPMIKPYLYQNGGNIIMIQVENEYGTYHLCQKEYIISLTNLVREYLGYKIVLFSIDGGDKYYLRCGNLDRKLFITLDFGIGEFNKAFRSLELLQPKGPWVNLEYYAGWCDAWGIQHQLVDADKLVEDMKMMWNYSSRISFSFFMMHGGTTFGLWNGHYTWTLGIPTSYDYDAPISEAGDITYKYIKIRETIQKIFPERMLPPIPANVTKMAYGKIKMKFKSGFLEHILKSEGIKSKYPLNMEKLGQYRGFMVYSVATNEFEKIETKLEFTKICDTAYVFSANGNFEYFKLEGVLASLYHQQSISLFPNEKLVVLTEVMGHFSSGRSLLKDLKGIVGNVSLGKNILVNWTHHPVNLSLINSKFKESRLNLRNFAIYEGKLKILESMELADTFVYNPDFGKGIVIVNDKILGRYWNTKGPQMTLYLPKNFLRVGQNIIKILELEPGPCIQKIKCTLEFMKESIFK